MQEDTFLTYNIFSLFPVFTQLIFCLRVGGLLSVKILDETSNIVKNKIWVNLKWVLINIFENLSLVKRTERILFLFLKKRSLFHLLTDNLFYLKAPSNLWAKCVTWALADVTVDYVNLYANARPFFIREMKFYSFTSALKYYETSVSYRQFQNGFLCCT